MPNYTCKLVTEQGNIVERLISADSISDISEIVAKNKEQLISAKKEGINLDLDSYLEKYKKIPVEQLKLFTNQLRTMMSSGVPLLASLDVLERQARK